MKKGFLRFIAVFMIVLVAAVYLPASGIDSALDIEASAGVIGGVAWNDVSLGGNVKWKFDKNNDVITVFGSGNMKDFKNGDDGQNWDALWGGSAKYPINRATKIVIQDGITNIGNNTFVGFKELKEVVIPASVKSIGTGAFKDNTKLTKVTIPSAVTVINSDTFSGCSLLSSINIHNKITSIGSNAFNGTKISSVDMPASVKSIGKNAFGTVKITCNYGDPGYTYCQQHSNATAVLRTPELKVAVTPLSETQLKATFSVKNGSGLNAANFEIKYNSDITPVSSERIVSQTETFVSAVSFGADNTISVGVVDANEIPFSSCKGECEYIVVEIVFNQKEGTHAAKFEFSSSVFMLGNTRYTLPAVSENYGDHIYQQSGEPVAPTCTEEGYTLFVCTICKDEQRENVKPALGHEYADTVTPPTCEDDGYTTHTCSRCGDSYTDTVVIASGHNLIESAVDATCTEKAKKVLTCDVCGESSALVIEESEINPDNHVNTEIKDASDATCTADGYTGDTYCNDCKQTVSTGSEIPALGHTEEIFPAVAPTCTTTGLTEGKKCSVCGEITVEQTEVSVLGHKEEVLPAVAPTCTATGLTEGKKCTVCGEITVAQTEVSVLGHKEEILPAVAPTCTTTGLTEGKKCTVCGEITVAQTEVPVSEHTYIPVITDPTCLTGGYTVYTCSVCEDTYTADETQATGHTPEIIPGKYPTATETGLTDGEKCSVCGEILKAQEEIPALGVEHTHDYVEVVTAPTCTTGGYTAYRCLGCGDTYIADEKEPFGHTSVKVPGKLPTETESGLTEGEACAVCGEILVAQEEIPALGVEHTHDYIAVVTDPTCTAKGYTTYTCVCGDTYVSDETEMIAHDYAETIVKEATCKENGEKNFTCKACGDTYTDVIAKLSHTEETIPATAPTCTQTGLTEGKKCSVCNEILVAQKEVPVTAHTYDAGVVTAPTCTAKGYTTYTCTVCKNTYTDNETAMIAHDYVETVIKTATCTAEGEKSFTCSMCNDTKAEKIPATGHTFDKGVVTTPTCTAQGYTTYKCVNCDYSEKRDSKNALGHNYGTDGKCTRCGATDNSKPAETVLEFKDNAMFSKNDADKTVLAKTPGTVAQVKQSMINSGWEITDANGNKLADDKDLTTGCLIKSADGKQIYAYAMLGDVNMDGKVTAADARAALRISAKLDTGTAVMLLAADCDGKERVTAADARIILRVSAKLQSFS